MKSDKIRSNLLQSTMYGVILLFTAIIVIAIIIKQSASHPDASILTATQQHSIQVTVEGSKVAMTVATPIVPRSTNDTAITSPAHGETQIPRTRTTVSRESPPASGNTPPNAGLLSGSNQTSEVPTNISTPPGLKTTSTQEIHPNNVTPPPTLQTRPTEQQPPAGITPPPTLQTTATEQRPPLGGTPPPTALPLGAGTYNDSNIAWQYSTGWTTYNGKGPYNDDFHYTGTVGDYVDLIFRGTGFILIYTSSPNRGLIEVYIDGAKIDTINAYSTTISWQSKWTSGTITNGIHTVRFAHGGSGPNIDVDAITILP